MRVTGLVKSARGLVPHGHLCWAYQDRADFHARASEYMVDAIAAGQWVQYVGVGSVEELRAELAEFDGVRQTLDGGGVGVSSVDEFYSQTSVVDPVRAADACVSAAKRTLAAGYSGFRAVVDATTMVRTPAQREVFARFEYLIDRQMSVLPVSALCAYDVGELGSAVVAEIACLHPLASAGSTLFHLYADEGVDFALAGEIDLSCADLFDTALERAMPLSSGPELIVDARGLEFIDHRGLLALAQAAQRSGVTVILRDPGHSVARVIELLELTDLQVKVTT